MLKSHKNVIDSGSFSLVSGIILTFAKSSPKLYYIMNKSSLLSFLFFMFSYVSVCAQSATIEQVWVDHNVTENGQKGMRIHTKVNVHNYRTRTFCMAVIHYFEYASGGPLLGDTPNYCIPMNDGRSQVVAEYRFTATPGWDHTLYNDIWRFIPYDALHSYGSQKLCFHTFVHDYTSGRFIQEEKKVSYFDYFGGTPPNNNQVFDFNNNSPGVFLGGGGNYYDNNNNTKKSNTHQGKTRHPKNCHNCSFVGNGKCARCGGSGKVQLTLSNPVKTTCSSCNGSGLCRTCHGTGKFGYDYY